MGETKRKRYRYIISPIATVEQKISEFGLDANSTYAQFGWIRVVIPDDMVLHKWKCDDYSTTEDRRRIADLEYDCFYYDKVNHKAVKANYLKKYPILKWSSIVEKRETAEKELKKEMANAKEWIERAHYYYVNNIGTNFGNRWKEVYDEYTAKYNELKSQLDNIESDI